MLRRRKHGTTDRLALPHQRRQKGEIAETVRSAPGRDPRIARFIRILTGMARERAGFWGEYGHNGPINGSIAFSSEVAAGSREENALKQKPRQPCQPVQRPS